MSIISKLKAFVDRADKNEQGVIVATEQNEDSFRERRKKRRVNAVPGTKVLLIDDSRTICVLLRKMLLQNQYEVFEAQDAETGLKIAFEQRPGLIFLDIVLPGINGFQALRQLRKDPRTKDVPVIMISGNVQATERYYAERIGADDFMKKPFSRFEVFHRIERLLNEQFIPCRQLKN